jgi:hypothetical protein
MTNISHLARLRFQPDLVVASVRTALRATISWRKLGGEAPMRAVFQAIAWASLPSDIKPHAMAAADKTALKDAVRAAAGVLYDSALGRRLMSMPGWQLEIADARSSGDCLVTDRKIVSQGVVYDLGRPVG